MKKILIVITTAPILLMGCIIESSTTTRATIYNATQHTITILPYSNGIVDGNDTIVLKESDSIQIAYTTEKGKKNQAGFSSDYFSDCDSVIITFDDSFSISHYFLEPINKTEKYYPYDSKRNILNLYSFEYSYLDKPKQTRNAHYSYIFKEQDYLDAKN